MAERSFRVEPSMQQGRLVLNVTVNQTQEEVSVLLALAASSEVEVPQLVETLLRQFIADQAKRHPTPRPADA